MKRTENYNARTLTNQDLTRISGGFWIKVILGALPHILAHWNDIEDGFRDGYNDYYAKH